MKLIIAEKPSLGRTIAGALPESFLPCDGYLKGQTIIVSWAFGHLLELKDIEDYFPKGTFKGWADIPYPFVPERFSFRHKQKRTTTGKLTLDDGAKNQCDLLSRLMNSDEVDEIVCAGDADREGEVIIRLILMCFLKKKCMVTRLWLPDQTEQTIRVAFNERKNVHKYDRLYDEGIARTYVDWILGINLSRSLSVRSQEALSVGRVICPIVEAIYKRDNEIASFVPQPYYNLENKETIELKSKIKFPSDELHPAQKRCFAYNTVDARVIDIVEKKKEVNPPKLFSLSSLQGVCGKQFKWKPSKTLEVLQSLYEQGYVTYPRTNTEYLSENEKDKVKEILQVIGEPGTGFKDTKRVFDDSKIESHSAITPTTKMFPSQYVNHDEGKLYQTILHRFLANFCLESLVYNVTEMTIHVGSNEQEEDILVKGNVLQQKGWTRFEENATKDTLLPSLHKGERFAVDFKPVKKETQPPKKFTVESLNQYLKHPLKKKDQTEDEIYKDLLQGCEIGTEATRAGIIEKALQKKYISLKKNVYSIEPKGRFLVETLHAQHLDMSVNRTVALQKTLKAVYHHEKSVTDAIQEAKIFMESYFENAKHASPNDLSRKAEAIGHCPWCGKEIIKIKSKKGVFYIHREKESKCDFFLGQKIYIYGQSIAPTENQIKDLFNGKTITVSLLSKAGNPYKVLCSFANEPTLYNGKKYVHFNTQYVNKVSRKK